jgi:type I restriction enzyme M protein
MNNFNEKVNFIWSVADLIRDVFKRSKYQDVILPFTVLRRIDCVLSPTKQQVLDTYRSIPSNLKNPAPLLTKASGFAFYNISRYDFDSLVADSKDLALNLRNYIAGFSDNMREVLEKFDFNNTIAKLDEAGLLYLVLERFNKIDLHPSSVSNLEMGYIFEELIRKFNEALDENPGEHFTPREVISLMVDLLLLNEKERLNRKGFIALVYDPCCGTGGMLTVAKDHILQINPKANVALYGQEVNPETFAVCKSDLYMKSADGRDAENIKFGSTLSNDQHAATRFDYLLANPPYGKEWKLDQKAVEAEYAKGDYGRFSAGLPRISDGQMLFLQHMLGRMRTPEDGGSRVAIVMNGSPLFTGDAGSGESEIRRWILENDWLEAIIALPEQLFYNTGIATYIWVLSNRKAPHRRGKVQLIDATSFYVQMRKGLGSKRREISDADVERIQSLYEQFDTADPDVSKVFDTIDFGYRKITVDRPLRLNFQVNAERLERLQEESGFKGLVTSKKRDPDEKAKEEAAGRVEQARIVAALQTMPDTMYKNRADFEAVLNAAMKQHDIKLAAPVRKAIMNALSERDETAEICYDKNGRKEADNELRDYEYIPLEYEHDFDPLAHEYVPLKQNIYDYFAREVTPHMPEAWINEDMRDDKDGGVGKVGYEINFNRYFYKYQPPRPLAEIESDIKKLEREILDMLKEVTE